MRVAGFLTIAASLTASQDLMFFLDRRGRSLSLAFALQTSPTRPLIGCIQRAIGLARPPRNGIRLAIIFSVNRSSVRNALSEARRDGE